MKKAFCLFIALFIGALCFAGTYEELPVDKELDEALIKVFCNIGNIDVLSKYKFNELKDIEKMTETNSLDWISKGQRTVKTCIDPSTYFVFVVKDRTSKDTVFIVIENTGFYEKYYMAF